MRRPNRSNLNVQLLGAVDHPAVPEFSVPEPSEPVVQVSIVTEHVGVVVHAGQVVRTVPLVRTRRRRLVAASLDVGGEGRVRWCLSGEHGRVPG